MMSNRTLTYVADLQITGIGTILKLCDSVAVVKKGRIDFYRVRFKKVVDTEMFKTRKDIDLYRIQNQAGTGIRLKPKGIATMVSTRPIVETDTIAEAL